MAAIRHDWYLKEWLKALQKKQEDLVRDLDWNKSRVSLTARGIQPYDRDDINEVATYLHIQPYELLMHPDDAFTIRRLLIEAKKMTKMGERLQIVSDRTGTEG
jgi:transcriptional regulator with XRE-family HTH domain